jgi:hypothetical protein
VILEKGHILVIGERGKKGALDLLPSEVAGMEYAPVAVAAFLCEIEGPTFSMSETHPPIYESAHLFGPFTHDLPDHVLAAETGAGAEGILDMAFE